MKKFLAIFGLAVVLATAGAGFTSNDALAGGGGKKHHHHHGNGHWGWGVGGLASGLALGFALNQPSEPVVQYQYVPYPAYPAYPYPVYQAYPAYNPYLAPVPVSPVQ